MSTQCVRRPFAVINLIVFGFLLGRLDHTASMKAEVAQVGESLSVGPNVGKNHSLTAPIDVYWDAKGRKLHARSLILTEIDDPVDLRFRRAPGKYPDGPLAGTSPPGNISGGLHWDALTDGAWRQVAGIEGMSKDHPAPPPTAADHPGWLTVYTYPHNYDDRLRRIIVDDAGAMSLGGGGFGGNGLPAPAYGFHLFGGNMRVQAVKPSPAPKATAVGRAGDVQYVYQIVACDSKGHESEPSTATIIHGPKSLTNDDFIRLQWDQCVGAETYLILRNGERLNLTFRGEGSVKNFDDHGFPSSPYRPVSRNQTADVDVDGRLTARHGIRTPGVCRAPELDGDVHDFDAPGLESCSTLVMKPMKSIALSGIAAPTIEGRWLLLVNDGDKPIAVRDDAGESKPVNRFRLGVKGGVEVAAGQTVCLVYTVERWRMISQGSVVSR
jgi:hypothetical protein